MITCGAASVFWGDEDRYSHDKVGKSCRTPALRCCRGGLENSVMQVSANFPLMSEVKNYIQQLLLYVTKDP